MFHSVATERLLNRTGLAIVGEHIAFTQRKLDWMSRRSCALHLEVTFQLCQGGLGKD